jgi:hypothetical protein
MSEIVYRITTLLEHLLVSVPLGTNLGLFYLLFALLSGRFLAARGAVFAALSDLGLPDAALRRSVAALCYGRFCIPALLLAWQKVVEAEADFTPHRYEGYSPVACDLTGFFRPHLFGQTNKHYQSQAQKALPALVFGLVASVGCVGKSRLALPRLLVRAEPKESDACLQKRLLHEAHKTLRDNEALIVDAGFALKDLLCCDALPFVVRAKKNFTARRNTLPAYKGRGRPPVYGARVRPLTRKRAGKERAATSPDAEARWTEGKHTLVAHLFENLVQSDQTPGSPSFRCVVIYDPRYQEPLVLVTNLPVTAYALWRLYRDRWPIEQLPLAAKQMLGCERAFVFGTQSRYRLPELALLAGNLLSYVAATSQPVATGFWDRAVRPTCGRLRRVLSRVHFSELPLPEGQLRKKASVWAHLPTGVKAHRRQKASPSPFTVPRRSRFTGN